MGTMVHGLSVSECLLIAGQIFNQNVLELRGGFNEYWYFPFWQYF